MMISRRAATTPTAATSGRPPAPSVNQAGFTIIELIVVIAIIGILAAVALPRLLRAPVRAEEAVLQSNLRTLRESINQFYADKGHFPPSLESLVEEEYLHRVPQDPITNSNETWQLEYEEYGDDFGAAETDFSDTGEPGIIDVYSGAEGLSLDGEAYSDW
jgi:general secretion pathway protein G